jgi:biotin carboxylase
MKLIMILGASILQLPAIQKAKEMGLQVIAVDMDKNAIGFKYADICLEVSTIDIPSVIEAAKKYKIDGIMTLASDMPMRTVAAISKEMGLIGITEDTAIKTTNKAVMRQCLKENKVPIPAFYKAITKEQYLKVLGNFESKCIVKPADNSGSRGVFFIKNISDKDLIDYAFEYSKKYSRNGEIIVESFMEGYEVSVET